MLPEVLTPSGGQWALAALAAFLVTAVGGALARRVIGRAESRWTRLASTALAMLAVLLVVVVVVLFGAGRVAAGIDALDDLPDNPLALRVLGVGDTPEAAARYDPALLVDVGSYAVAALGSLAATLVVLAIAVVRAPESSGLRYAAGGFAALCLVAAILVVAGDAGPLATGVAAAVLLLGFLAAWGVTTEELRRRLR